MDVAVPGGTAPAEVQLHLDRRIGWGLYGTVTAVVFVLVVLGIGANLISGSFLTAGVIAVFGLGLTGFLAVVTRAMVVPALTASAAGIRGRMPSGRTIDAGWNEISIDVDDDEGRSDTIRLDVGEESVLISRSWVGFPEFLFLLASTRDAAARSTPAAQQQVVRLLLGPGASYFPADRPGRPPPPG